MIPARKAATIDADGLTGSADRHGVLDALVRCSGKFNHAVNIVVLRMTILLVSLT